MAAPVGNQNAAKAKQWAAAIERALERRGNPNVDPDHPSPRSPRAKALDEMAGKFLDTVLMPSSGVRGFQELGDRLDGRPAQTIQGPDGGSVFGPMVASREELAKKLRG